MKYRIQKLIYRDQIQSGVIKRIYNLLITQPKVHREAYELNKQPVRWINFKNGYYDPITGEMLEHNPDYLTINQIPFPYYPEDREQVMQGLSLIHIWNTWTDHEYSGKIRTKDILSCVQCGKKNYRI